jgi:hypothetical protein
MDKLNPVAIGILIGLCIMGFLYATNGIHPFRGGVAIGYFDVATITVLWVDDVRDVYVTLS